MTEKFQEPVGFNVPKFVVLVANVTRIFGENALFAKLDKLVDGGGGTYNWKSKFAYEAFNVIDGTYVKV